jgi:hypothetical protein
MKETGHNSNGIPALETRLADCLARDIETIAESVALGHQGDPLNLVNLLVALGQATGDFRHPLIQSASRQLLCFPRSYPAEGFWDVLLRFDTAAYCGIPHVPDPHGIVGTLFAQYGMKHARFEQEQGTDQVPVDALVAFRTHFMKGELLKTGCDPRIIAFFAHYLLMLRGHCGMNIPSRPMEGVLDIAVLSARQTIHDAGNLDQETVYKRLGITCHVVSLAQRWGQAIELAGFILQYLSQAAPPIDQAAFLIWDLSLLEIAGCLVEKDAERVRYARVKLAEFIANARDDISKNRLFPDIREIGVCAIGAASFLPKDVRAQMLGVVDRHALVRVLSQIRNEIMLNASDISRRRYVEEFLQQFKGANDTDLMLRLHKYISKEIKREDEIYEHVRSVRETIESGHADCDCVAALLATVLVVRNLPGYIVFLDPEFSRPGHIYVEWINDAAITQRNEDQRRDLIAMDPLFAEYGAVAEMVRNKEDSLIRILISDMVSWTPDDLLRFIHEQKRLINAQ